jgi:2-methylcitrate dehydratase
MAAPNAAFGAVHALSLAANGITGPEEMFEGNKGLMDSITGPFHIAWDDEPLDRALRCSIKRHNAEFHSQSAIDAALQVRAARDFDVEKITRVRVDTFATGFHIIGGGEEGDKKIVRTKEDADHSLPYIVSAALLDGEVTPRQYLPDRMSRSDIRDLLQRTDVVLDEEFSERFPDEMPATVTVEQRDGIVLTATTTGYHGFHTDPFAWDDACEKFDALTHGLIDDALRADLVEAVDELSERPVSHLTALLARVPREP